MNTVSTLASAGGNGWRLTRPALQTGPIVGPAFAGIVSDRLGSFTVPSIMAAVALLFAAALTRH